MSLVLKIGIAVIVAMLIGFQIPTSGNETNSVSITSFSNTLPLKKGKVYFILRGSDTKLGSFANQYNKENSKATHVALGIFTDSLHIYHVNTDKLNGKQLLLQGMEEFTHSQKTDYTYLAFWEINDLTEKQIDAIERKIAAFQEKDIRFDYKFDMQSDENLYCSEFVYKVINSIGSTRFELPMTRKKVPENHVFFLKKDTLEYYPSDFFYDYANLKKIGEWSK